MYETVLFDLDGTLTDPGLGITNSVMYALDKMGFEVPEREELYPFIGPPLHESFQTYCAMTGEQAQEAIRFYREYFFGEGSAGKPGVRWDHRYADRVKGCGKAFGAGHLQAGEICQGHHGAFRSGPIRL